MSELMVRTLGEAGLRLEVAEIVLDIDPPAPGSSPAIVTWSETERLIGVRGGLSPHVAADRRVLDHLGIDGLAFREGEPQVFAGATLTALAFQPIPWATPVEWARKLASGLRDPRLALSRLRRTLRRPHDPPYALSLQIGPWKVACLQQSLHRFQSPAQLDRLLRFADDADLVIAGTDYDDERATAHAFHGLDARHLVLVDAVGPIRRRLGLPTRPLAFTLDRCPPRTRILTEALHFAE